MMAMICLRFYVTCGGSCLRIFIAQGRAVRKDMSIMAAGAKGAVALHEVQTDLQSKHTAGSALSAGHLVLDRSRSQLLVSE